MPLPPYGVIVNEYGVLTVAFGTLDCDRICSGDTVNVIARSNLLPTESVTRIDVLKTPGVVRTPR